MVEVITMRVPALRSRQAGPLSLGGLVGAWATVAVVLSFVLLATWHDANAEHDRAERTVARSIEIVGLLATLERRVVDLETGMRGFALTGERVFLAPYAAAREDIGPDFSALVRLVHTDRPSVADARRVRRDVEAYIGDFAQPFIDRGTRDRLLLRQYAVLEGRSRMRAVKKRLASMRTRQEDLLVADREAGAAQGDRVQRAGLAATVGILLAIIGLTAGILLGVVRPVRRMTAAARTIAAGGDAALLDDGGRGEIRALGAALSEMSTSWQARERTVAEQRDLLDAILEELGEAIIACDVDGRLTVANPAGRRLLGISESVTLDDAAVRAAVRLLDLEGAPLSGGEYPLARTLREGEIDGMEFLVAPQGGRLRHAEANGRALRDADGRVIGAVVAARDVTTERAVADALRASEERHRVVLESVGEVVFETDGDAKWTFLSPLWTQITGRAVEDALGRHIMEFVYENDRAALREWIRDIVAERQPTARLQHRYRTADGEIRWADIKLRLTYHADGRLAGTLGTLHDMTDRLLAAQALERLQRRHTWILESAGEGILGVDADGRITFANGAAARMAGCTASELEGRRAHDLIGASQPWEQSPLHEALTGGDAVSAEEEAFRPRNGEPLHIEYTASPILENGVVAGGVVVFRDVSEQRRTAAALEREREFQEALVESLHDGIVACDAKGTITLYNQASEDLLGIEGERPLDPASLRGSLLSADGQTILENAELPLFRALEGEEIRDVEITVARPGEPRRSVLASGRAIRDAGGRKLGAVVATHDITERRRAERLKDEFLALVSHELRTPLTSIVGYVEMLREEGDDDPATRERFLSIVQRNAGRLQRLVSDLLFVAQLESGTLALDVSETDLTMVVEDAVEAARVRSQRRGLTITTELEELRPVHGDRDRLAQAIDNLISNAIKYTPDGGTITVRAYADCDDAVIDVADNGIGIAADDEARLFDRFFRGATATERQIQGVGLGLSIVKAIIDGHGGRLSVDSEVGVGSTFQLRLPRTSVADGALKAAGPWPNV
jgi:PAS domain S-box-containing protein